MSSGYEWTNYLTILFPCASLLFLIHDNSSMFRFVFVFVLHPFIHVLPSLDTTFRQSYVYGYHIF